MKNIILGHFALCFLTWFGLFRDIYIWTRMIDFSNACNHVYKYIYIFEVVIWSVGLYRISRRCVTFSKSPQAVKTFYFSHGRRNLSLSIAAVTISTGFSKLCKVYSIEFFICTTFLNEWSLVACRAVFCRDIGYKKSLWPMLSRLSAINLKVFLHKTTNQPV